MSERIRKSLTRRQRKAIIYLDSVIQASHMRMEDFSGFPDKEQRGAYTQSRDEFLALSRIRAMVEEYFDLP